MDRNIPVKLITEVCANYCHSVCLFRHSDSIICAIINSKKDLSPACYELSLIDEELLLT